MKRNTFCTVTSSTNAQIALSFLAVHPEKDFLPADVQAATGLSKAGTYLALSALEEEGLISANTRGRTSFYAVNTEDVRVRQFKVLQTVTALAPYIAKLQPLVRKVVLFGSASRGEDASDSDVDLFIVAKDVEEARRNIAGWKLKRKVQPVIKTAVDVSNMEETDAVFMREVACGIALWEEKDAT